VIIIFYKKIKVYLPEIYVIFGYVVLTLVLLYPVVLNFNLFIGSSSDVYQVIWGFWWLKKVLINLCVNPFYTYYIFYPSGVNLTFFTLTYFNSIFSIPLQILFGLVASYNLMVFFSFVMSGYGVYLLVKYLTGNKGASFISGVIFAFSPFRSTAALGHMHVLTTQWIPFYVLYLIKTIKEKKTKNAIFTAIFFVLTSLGNFEYALYISLFTIFLFIFFFFTDRKIILNKFFIKNMILIAVISLIMLIPFIYPMFKEWSSSSYMKKTLDGSIVTSADIFAFFIPSERHPIFSTYFKKIYDTFSSNEMERVVFVGYTSLAFSIYSAVKIKNKDIKFWVFSAICFFVLSLGPVLHVFGRFLFPSPFKLGNLAKTLGVHASNFGYELLDNFVGIPLPYLLLYLFFPFFSVTRTPSRLSIMLMLSIAILSGYAISKISNKFKKRRIVFLIVTLSLIIFEFLPLPFPSQDSSIPNIYNQIALEPGDYAIVEAPISLPYYMYYQSLHNKKIVGGIFGRRPSYTDEFVNSVSLLRELKIPTRKIIHNNFLENVMRQNPEASPIIKKYIESEGDIYSSEQIESQKKPSRNDVELLKQNNIKYIILHKNFLDEQSFDRMNNMLKTILNDNHVYEDGDLIVYKVY